MTSYFYFAMSVIMWDWFWFTKIPEWTYQQRIALVLFLTFSLAIDIFSIYEYFKSKR
jgi:hypothetical protein